MRTKFISNMTTEQAIDMAFSDNGRSKLFPADSKGKEAADTYSESLKSKWHEGIGHITGPFYDDGKRPRTWYEVRYK